MTTDGRLVVLAALAATLVLGACAGEEADLAGRTFTITEVRGHDLVEGSTVTLAFEENGISAQAGCNTLNGAASWDGGTLDVQEPMASTRLACEEALRAQDQWLASFLTSSPALEVDGEVLTLDDDTTRMTLAEQP
ncbi:MAG TPA: META domain-containing protein [Ornithinibacter sp.]|nr:META domain-containing protein [Ornithinibacter sp.]